MSEVKVIRIPPGIGKTHAMRRVAMAAVAKGKRVAIYAPTVALGREIAHPFGPLARVWLGRDQPDPDVAGQSMCQRADVARAVGEAGQSPGKGLCPDCLFKARCSYLAQSR